MALWVTLVVVVLIVLGLYKFRNDIREIEKDVKNKSKKWR